MMGVDFKARQHEFSDYLRNPEKHPAPADVKPERMAMYRELFFNNIDNFLAVNFPVLRKILSDAQWRELAGDFFARHTCKTPYFSEIAEEFLYYIQTERDNPSDPPFMLELAHYEWAEMALSISKEDHPADPLSPGDWTTANLYVSPLAWPLAYRFPVHRISPDYQPPEPPDQPTFLVVYRNPEDEVRFLEITPVTYQLLALIQEQPGQSATAYLQRLSEQLRHPQPEIIYQGGLKILKDLAAKHIILSTAQG